MNSKSLLKSQIALWPQSSIRSLVLVIPVLVKPLAILYWERCFSGLLKFCKTDGKIINDNNDRNAKRYLF